VQKKGEIMPVTQNEKVAYKGFALGIIDRLGSLAFDPDLTVWHYTNGSGLVGILQSGQIFATQVACLNDSTETLYAQRLYKASLLEVEKQYSDNQVVQSLFKHFATEFQDDSTTAASSPSKFFVACFTQKKNDLSQWRAYSDAGGENGFAIGFRVGGLFGGNRLVVRVNYDRDLHLALAGEVAEATVNYFLKGLEDDPSRSSDTWAVEFFEAWDEQIYGLSPIIKDPGFKEEDEIRIVHELQINELGEIQMRQKRTLLGRYVALNFGLRWVGRKLKLPVTCIVVGPSRHPAVSRVSVGTLLHQLGYEGVPVEISTCPLQSP
jgi:hypothetical protein